MESSTPIASATDKKAIPALGGNSELLAAVSSLQSAFMVVCLETDTTLLMSDGMRTLLAAQPNSSPWRAAMASEPDLHDACERAIHSSQTESIADIDVAGNKRRVCFKKHQNTQLFLMGIFFSQTQYENLLTIVN